MKSITILTLLIIFQVVQGRYLRSALYADSNCPGQPFLVAVYDLELPCFPENGDLPPVNFTVDNFDNPSAVLTSQYNESNCQSEPVMITEHPFNNCTAFPGVDNLFWIPREVLTDRPPMDQQPPEFPQVDNLLPVITTQVWFELGCPQESPNFFFHRTSICSQNLDEDGGLIFATLDCPEVGGDVIQVEFSDNQCSTGAVVSTTNFPPNCLAELNSMASVMITCQENINAPRGGSDSGLSVGAIAGIVVAGCCVLCLIVGLAVLSLIGFKKVRSQSKKLAEQEQRIELSEEDKKSIKVIKIADLAFTKEVGRGAFGQVWMGKWNGKTVAIKKQLSTAPITVQETLSEFTIQYNIPKHKNVVELLGFCPHPVAIVLEFCGGGSLRVVLDSDREIKNSEIQLWVKGIASGMKHIHQHNITHRDLAARNVLLADDMSPKISDFGLSRELAAEEGVTVSVVGPLKWMAPECLLEQKYGEKTDVFAFGVTCLEIYTRRLPYSGIKNQEYAIKWSTLIKTLPDQLPVETPEPMRNLLLKMWSTTPEDRPTFGGIIDALNEIFEKDTVSSKGSVFTPSVTTPSLVALEPSNYDQSATRYLETPTTEQYGRTPSEVRTSISPEKEGYTAPEKDAPPENEYAITPPSEKTETTFVLPSLKDPYPAESNSPKPDSEYSRPEIPDSEYSQPESPKHDYSHPVKPESPDHEYFHVAKSKSSKDD